MTFTQSVGTDCSSVSGLLHAAPLLQGFPPHYRMWKLMKNAVSPFPSVDFIFIHFVPVCQDWMSGKEGEVTKALSSQTLSAFCFVLPLFPGVNYRFFSYPCIFFVLVFFPRMIAFYPCCLDSFFWCWEILSFEVFPILVNIFGSNKHQNVVQANSAIHTLIFLIYFWLMFTHSSQPISNLEHFFLCLWPLQTLPFM